VGSFISRHEHQKSQHNGHLPTLCETTVVIIDHRGRSQTHPSPLGSMASPRSFATPDPWRRLLCQLEEHA